MAEVIQADIDAAVKADDGAIAAARALSARDCGALQSEMREARKAFLAQFLADYRIAGQAELVEALERARNVLEQLAPNGLALEAVNAALQTLSQAGEERS